MTQIRLYGLLLGCRWFPDRWGDKKWHISVFGSSNLPVLFIGSSLLRSQSIERARISRIPSLAARKSRNQSDKSCSQNQNQRAVPHVPARSEIFVQIAYPMLETHFRSTKPIVGGDKVSRQPGSWANMLAEMYYSIELIFIFIFIDQLSIFNVKYNLYTYWYSEYRYWYFIYI